jgi:hypothetical protein
MHTEENVLKDDGLLRQLAEVALCRRRRVGTGLLLDARPGEVHVKEQEEDAETNYGWLARCG